MPLLRIWGEKVWHGGRLLAKACKTDVVTLWVACLGVPGAKQMCHASRRFASEPFDIGLERFLTNWTQERLVVTVAASPQMTELSIAETNFTNSWDHVTLGTVPLRLMPADVNGL